MRHSWFFWVRTQLLSCLNLFFFRKRTRRNGLQVTLSISSDLPVHTPTHTHPHYSKKSAHYSKKQNIDLICCCCQFQALLKLKQRPNTLDHIPYPYNRSIATTGSDGSS